MRNIFITITISLVGGFSGAHLYNVNFIPSATFDSTVILTKVVSNYEENKAIVPAKELSQGEILLNEEDFVYAAAESRSSVVFIKTLNEVAYRTGGWLDWFFEGRSGQQQGSGSGVIYSNDGYIITNNHVIDEADIIKVIHGKRTYEATLIGTDPSTDLAVIKIEADNLPNVKIGNSDNLKVGEWVLAIGNPFNLNSTVTAGIVSAKGRNINLLRDKFPIESFIQTDAAINPGNSGGALVNIKGELIGINTAILSRTGSYTGYGFAVPVNITNKVVRDIIEYGEVQKAFLGADFHDLDSEIAEKLDIDNLDGIIITRVQADGAADKAGLGQGDIIVAVNSERVNDRTRLEELIGYSYPGDKMEITIRRGKRELQKSVTLTNIEGTTSLIKRDIYMSEKLGVEFEVVPKVERDLLGIKSGIRVSKIYRGDFAHLEIPEGFIITHLNHSLHGSV